MKDVYSHIISIAVDRGKRWDYVFDWQYGWRYGEVPKNETKLYDNQETVFDDLAIAAGWLCEEGRTVLRKREYICFPRGGRIYKDKLKAAKVSHYYIKQNNVSFNELSRELSSEEFTEYIFDREHELQSLYALQNK